MVQPLYHWERTMAVTEMFRPSNAISLFHKIFSRVATTSGG
jgi:hypothetical protein